MTSTVGRAHTTVALDVARDTREALWQRATVVLVTHDEATAAAEPVDLLAAQGTGPLWGMASADLNATLLSWRPGHEVPEHINADLDVLIVVLAGRVAVVIDGSPHDLQA